MKRLCTLFLIAVLLLSLCACGGTTQQTSTRQQDQDTGTAEPEANGQESDVPQSNDQSGTSDGVGEPDETEEVEEPDVPEIQEQTLDMMGMNILEGVAELTFTNAFTTEKLTPPMVSGVHVSYTPADGKIYLVLCGEVMNATTTAAKAGDLMSLTITAQEDAAPVAASCYGVSDGGSDLDRDPAIDPLSSQQIYFVFAVPQGTENGSWELTLIDRNDVRYTGSFSVNLYEAARPGLSVGDTLSDETIELTVEDVYFSTTLYPPKMSGYYHYYEAESGKTYLIVKVRATNLKGSAMKYDTIAGVSCVYSEKYNYSSFCVLEKDGGSDLNGYPSQYSIDPLDSGVCYYLMEVPEVVQQGPVTVSVYAAGTYYTMQLS